MIALSHLTFAFPGRPNVLTGLDLAIEDCSHTAIMGANGSGKSTLALVIKGFLAPAAGTVTVDGFSAADEYGHDEVMRRVGIVFQNPDNAIVSTTVEREIAFGLENLGVPGPEMHERVEDALRRFDLGRYRFTSPEHLSGGEKQRLALAAVMAMRPRHLILDEPTSLLDPEGGERILGLIHETARTGTTVIHITQSVREALTADRLIVLDGGTVVLDGPPGEVLRDTARYGIGSLGDLREFDESPIPGPHPETSSHGPGEPLMSLRRVSFTYDAGTPFAHRALIDADLDIRAGGAVALLGPSGSGKTTLLEIAAGLTAPTSGDIVFHDDPIRAMAFQFPEDEVFGDTVDEYVEFGPKNLGFTPEDATRVADAALTAVGLDPARFRDRDPFTLSGGEKRRAAIAGVLAMNPRILVLDEPTAGLDRRSTDRITGILGEYVRSGGSLLFSTHDFRVAWRLAGTTAVLHGGRIETRGETAAVFTESPWLRTLRE